MVYHAPVSLDGGTVAHIPPDGVIGVQTATQIAPSSLLSRPMFRRPQPKPPLRKPSLNPELLPPRLLESTTCSLLDSVSTGPFLQTFLLIELGEIELSPLLLSHPILLIDCFINEELQSRTYLFLLYKELQPMLCLLLLRQLLNMQNPYTCTSRESR